MGEVGMTKPSGSEEEMLRLNVGGALVNIRRSALEGRGHLGHLFESVWDKRLPRDSDGFVVLDHSPKCVKHIIHTNLNPSNSASSEPQRKLHVVPGDGLAADEEPYFPYVASALGLAEHLPAQVIGGSTVLAPDEIIPMSATVLGWCPGSPSQLELVYRASRDGWSAWAFHARCGNDSPSTITLYRVSGLVGTSCSVVGGFSNISWAPQVGFSYGSSREAFLFMLKDGRRPGLTSFQPVKWDVKEETSSMATVMAVHLGPWFGSDLGMSISNNGPGTLTTGNRVYDVPWESPFPSLGGQNVVEIETFRVCSANTTPPVPPRTPGLMDIPALDTATVSTEGGRDDDIRSFGVFVADSLMEEKTALVQAHDELAEANSKAALSAKALAAVYGPEVAAGKEDTVVNLNVRGTRMTTLRSTLQACPDSALDAMFDEEKWPATEKDVDERGRRVMDCRPSVFSKVLDVLRMRKQAGWMVSGGSGENNVRVVVKDADRPAFEEFVGMYFPGCESFIMDFVADTPKGGRAGR